MTSHQDRLLFYCLECGNEMDCSLMGYCSVCKKEPKFTHLRTSEIFP